MDFDDTSDQELLAQLEKLARSERKLTHLILCHINEAESRRLYAELGYGSMLVYLIKHLAYSESAAYRRLQAARLLKQTPSVAEKIESGALNLSQLTQVQRCLKEECKKTGESPSLERTEGLLKSLENKTTFETEKALALEFNRPVKTQELHKPQKDSSVRVELTFTQEEYEVLQQTKSLLSHSCPQGSLSEVIMHLAQKLVRAKLGKDFQSPTQGATKAGKQTKTVQENPHEKENLKESTERNPEWKPEVCSQETANNVIQKKNPREFVSIKTKRLLLEKAHHCCEYVHPQTGLRCTSSHQLQVEHIKPIAFGGRNDLSNLMILCRTHNLHAAENLGLRCH